MFSFNKNIIKKTKIEVFNLANLKNGEKVLILCCGIGTEAIIAREYVGELGYILGLDINKKYILEANRKIKEKRIKNIKFIIKDVSNVDDYYNSFDVVICIFGLHYFNNKKSIINKWIKCLNKNGRLIIADWDKSDRNYYIDSINNTIRKYLLLNDRIKIKNNLLNYNYKEFNLKFKITYSSFLIYWNNLKNSDLFFRLKNDLKKSDYIKMINEIEENIKKILNKEIIEIKNVYIKIYKKE